MSEVKITPIDDIKTKYLEGLIKQPEFLGRYIALKHNIRNFFLVIRKTVRDLDLFKLNEEELYWYPVSEEYVKTIVQQTFNELIDIGIIEYERKGEGDEVKPFLSTKMVKEIVEFIRREYVMKIEEETYNTISFKNAFVNMNNLLKGIIEGSIIEKKGLEAGAIPLSLSHIPHNLRIKELKEYFSLGEIEIESEKELFEIEAPKAVNIFKQWVNEDWLLLFEIIGYCFVPYYPFNKAFMLIGSGANGKSTFLTLVRRILGEQNVSSVSLQDLNEKRFAAVQLFNKLANIFPDLPSKPLKYTGIFKLLTGEDMITADRKFKEPISFINRAKLIFSCNQLPEVIDTSEAFFDRFVIIQFPNKFPRTISNEDFIKNNFNEEEIEKIIALSLYAIYLVLKRGTFTAPKVDIKEEWLRKSDSVYAFVKDMLKEGIIEENKELNIEGSILHELYSKYCEKNDIESKNIKEFYRSLEERFGYTKYKKEGYTYVKGITVKKEKLSDYIEGS
jgi:putative DNA primase/helicase